MWYTPEMQLSGKNGDELSSVLRRYEHECSDKSVRKEMMIRHFLDHMIVTIGPCDNGYYLVVWMIMVW